MRLLCLIVISTITLKVSADVLYLNDGSSIAGDVKKSETGWIVIGNDGATTRVSAERVKSIEATPIDKAVGDPSRERLASLRRSVENVADIHRIIDRYRQFISQNSGTAAETDAAKDLTEWQNRLDTGLVRYGGRWITPAERQKLQLQSLAVLDQARQGLKQGRQKEASELLDKLLSADPRNAGALYLRGVILYRQERIAEAKKNFETVAGEVPDCASALNNLGVTTWRQNLPAVAMNFYDGAMLASPLNKEILNNVAEALHAMPKESVGAPVVQRALRHFTEQDTKLQEKLAGQGLYRWGATWARQEEMDRLKAVEKQIKSDLDDLSGQFDKAKAGLATIDGQIESNDRSLRQMEATSWYRDAEGNIQRAPLPPIYIQIQSDNDQLKRQRVDQLAKLDQFRDSAKQIQQKLPVPRYTGVQQIIGEEGTPTIVNDPIESLAPSTAPVATQPATRPAAQ